MSLLAVEDALAQVLAAARLMPAERVALTDALGRVMATQLAATRTQPPFAASAMDGYALRAHDLVTGSALRVIGTSAAGEAFSGTLGPHQAVRIFTGAPVPEGADTIVLQEHVTRQDDSIIPTTDKDRHRHIRKAGLDFTAGQILIQQGDIVTPSLLALAAAMGHADLAVACRPKVAILANGDELVAPGEPCGPDQIVASNQFALAGLTQLAGGEALQLGIAPDDLDTLEARIDIALAQKADILVTLGGASVGDRDLIRTALERRGMKLGFWKIAMRPGKPLIFGALDTMLVLGLPGNPVSSIICGTLFLVPLIKKMLGLPDPEKDLTHPALLGAALPENDLRQDYIRASLTRDPESGQLVATPFGVQDSSMLSVIAKAQALIVRKPHAATSPAGSPCRILPL
jgi:molybdopterin molybdotransferase